MNISKNIFSAILVLFILPVLSSGEINGPAVPSDIVLEVTGPTEEMLVPGQVYTFTAISRGSITPSTYTWIIPPGSTVAPENEDETDPMETDKNFIRLKMPNASNAYTIEVNPSPDYNAYSRSSKSLIVYVLKVNMLTPAGSKTPNQSPDLAGEGQNIYCFNDAGELTISLLASSPVYADRINKDSKFVLSNFDAETVDWTNPANGGIPGTSGQYKLVAQAKITQFPDDASKGIGLNQASFLYKSSALASASYEVFFPPDKSLTKDGISTPLWFLYWKSMGALDDMDEFVYGGTRYEDGKYIMGQCTNYCDVRTDSEEAVLQSTLTLYEDAANINLIKNYTIYDRSGNVSITTEYPIENVACTILHELKHKKVQGDYEVAVHEEALRRLHAISGWEQHSREWILGRYTDLVDDARDDLDDDGDMILDAHEADLGVDPSEPFTFTPDREDKEVVADKAMIDYKDIIHYDLDYSKGGQLWKKRNK